MKRVFKLPLYLLLLILVIVSAVAYIYYFTTLPETEINNYLRAMTGRKLGLEVGIQKVNRDIWNGLQLEGLEIYPESGSRKPIAIIPRLKLKYNFRDLLRGKYEFSSLEMDTIEFRWPEDGKLLPKSEQTSGGKKSSLSLSFDRISIGFLRTVFHNGDIITADSLLASVRVDKGALSFGIENLSASWPSRKLHLNSLVGKIESTENGYRIDSLDVGLGLSRLAVRGVTGKSFTRDLNLEFALSPLDFEEIRNLFNVKLDGMVEIAGSLRGSIDNLEGRARIDGYFFEKSFENITADFAFSNKILILDSISGNIAEAGINGRARFDFGVRPEQYSYNGIIHHLDLRNIGPDLLTDFTGKVDIQGRGFNQRDFLMNISCDLDSVTIDSFYFDNASGPLKFDLNTLWLLPGFQGRYKDTYLALNGSLEYSGDLDIKGTVEFDDLTDFTDQTFLAELGGRGNAEIHATGPTADFSVAASFTSDSCWTYGLYPGRIRINTSLKSFISHRVGWVTGSWTGGTLYSLASDSGIFQATVSGERVFIDSVAVLGPLGSLALKGEYDGTRLPPLFRADSLYGDIAGNRFFSREPLVFSLHEDRTVFERFLIGLGTGTINATGNVTINDQVLDLKVMASNFQIEPIVAQFYKDKRIRGIWWGTAGLTGDLDNPIIDFDLQVDSLAINDSLIGDLDARMVYQNGYIHTDSTHLTSDYGEYLFSGNLPIDLSFGEVETRLPETAIDLRMRAFGNRLVLSEVFIPNVERFETDFSLEMSLGGTYSKPTISGRGTLLNGELKVLDLVNPIKNLKAYVRMENETIYIDSAFADVPGGEEWTNSLSEIFRSSKKEKALQIVNASGTIKLITLGIFDYDITVDGRSVYFESDAYDVRGLANFNVRVLGEKIPTVIGNITLQRLEIRDEFEKFLPPDYDPNIVVEDSTIWNLDLEITAPNNLWIRNNEVDAELKGDLWVERHVGVLTILGTLDFIRGTYNLYGQRFRIESGTMQYKNVSNVNPDIDFTVKTRIRNRPSDIGGSQFTPVDMHITGTLIEPRIDVSSASILSREDLMKYLLFRSEVNPFAAGPLNGISGTILQGLTSTLPTIIPGLSGVGIVDALEISQTEKGQTQISLAKYISRSLYVQYSQRLSQESGRTIGVEYYLNDNVSLNVTRGTQETTEHEGISFDLNLNFEF